MTRKTALTLIVVVIVVAILIVGFFLFFKQESQSQNPVFQAARNFFGGFFPTEGPSVNGDLQEPDTNIDINGSVIPKLRQISPFPVAGGIMFDRKATTTSLLVGTTTAQSDLTITEVVYRFVERATGHIYETTSRDLSQKRITNTTIPSIQEAYFSKNGEKVAMIYLEDGAIETFLGTINYPKPATSTIEQESESFAAVSGTFLPAESYGFAVSDTSDNFAFLNRSDDAEYLYKTGVYTGNLNNNQQKNIKTLETSEWQTSVLKDGTIALNTKPSFISEGFLYFLNPASGNLLKKLGNTFGLTSLPNPSGEKILYSYYDSGTTKVVLFDNKTKLYTTLGFATIVADKCVWSRLNETIVFCSIPQNLTRGDFPDVWYQGKFAFNDGIIRLDTADFTTTTLMPANSEVDQNLDIYNLQLSPKEDYLMFMNRLDYFLWSLDIA